MTPLRIIGMAVFVAVMTTGLYFGAVAQSGDDSLETAIIAFLVSVGFALFAVRGFPRA